MGLWHSYRGALAFAGAGAAGARPRSRFPATRLAKRADGVSRRRVQRERYDVDAAPALEAPGRPIASTMDGRARAPPDRRPARIRSGTSRFHMRAFLASRCNVPSCVSSIGYSGAWYKTLFGLLHRIGHFTEPGMEETGRPTATEGRRSATRPYAGAAGDSAQGAAPSPLCAGRCRVDDDSRAIHLA